MHIFLLVVACRSAKAQKSNYPLKVLLKLQGPAIIVTVRWQTTLKRLPNLNIAKNSQHMKMV